MRALSHVFYRIHSSTVAPTRQSPHPPFQRRRVQPNISPSSSPLTYSPRPLASQLRRSLPWSVPSLAVPSGPNAHPPHLPDYPLRSTYLPYRTFQPPCYPHYTPPALYTDSLHLHFAPFIHFAPSCPHRLCLHAYRPCQVLYFRPVLTAPVLPVPPRRTHPPRGPPSSLRSPCHSMRSRLAYAISQPPHVPGVTALTPGRYDHSAIHCGVSSSDPSSSSLRSRPCRLLIRHCPRCRSHTARHACRTTLARPLSTSLCAAHLRARSPILCHRSSSAPAAPCTIRTARSTPLSVSVTFLSSRRAPAHVPPITLSSAGFHRSCPVLAAIHAPLNTLASACRAGVLPVIRIAVSSPSTIRPCTTKKNSKQFAKRR
jgi:hypothetical protein